MSANNTMLLRNLLFAVLLGLIAAVIVNGTILLATYNLPEEVLSRDANDSVAEQVTVVTMLFLGLCSPPRLSLDGGIVVWAGYCASLRIRIGASMKMKISHKAKILTFAYAIAIPIAVVVVGSIVGWR